MAWENPPPGDDWTGAWQGHPREAWLFMGFWWVLCLSCIPGLIQMLAYPAPVLISYPVTGLWMGMFAVASYALWDLITDEISRRRYHRKSRQNAKKMTARFIAANPEFAKEHGMKP